MVTASLWSFPCDCVPMGLLALPLLQACSSKPQYNPEKLVEDSLGSWRKRHPPCWKRITLGGQGVLRIKVRTGGGDVERLWSDKDGLWCKVEDFGSVLWPSLAAADLGAQGKHVV
ncbi:hypothetical protein Tco_0855321 [Tanacetum coccineum]